MRRSRAVDRPSRIGSGRRFVPDAPAHAARRLRGRTAGGLRHAQAWHPRVGRGPAAGNRPLDSRTACGTRARRRARRDADDAGGQDLQACVASAGGRTQATRVACCSRTGTRARNGDRGSRRARCRAGTASSRLPCRVREPRVRDSSARIRLSFGTARATRRDTRSRADRPTGMPVRPGTQLSTKGRTPWTSESCSPRPARR